MQSTNPFVIFCFSAGIGNVLRRHTKRLGFLTGLCLLLLGVVGMARAEIVHGKVTDLEGNPLKGAEVYLFENSSHPEKFTKTVTGANGRFELEDISAESPRRILLAYKDGRAVDAWDLADIENQSGSIHLKLPQPQPVTVQFLDPQGEPLANTQVRIDGVYFTKGDDSNRVVQSISGRPVLFARFRFQTDEEGRFELDMLPSSCRAVTTLLSQDFGEQSAVVRTRDEKQIVRLRPVGRLTRKTEGRRSGCRQKRPAEHQLAPRKQRILSPPRSPTSI